jgi:hypothetical protein
MKKKTFSRDLNHNQKIYFYIYSSRAFSQTDSDMVELISFSGKTERGMVSLQLDVQSSLSREVENNEENSM